MKKPGRKLNIGFLELIKIGTHLIGFIVRSTDFDNESLQEIGQKVEKFIFRNKLHDKISIERIVDMD